MPSIFIIIDSRSRSAQVGCKREYLPMIQNASLQIFDPPAYRNLTDEIKPEIDSKGEISVSWKRGGYRPEWFKGTLKSQAQVAASLADYLEERDWTLQSTSVGFGGAYGAGYNFEQILTLVFHKG